MLGGRLPSSVGAAAKDTNDPDDADRFHGDCRPYTSGKRALFPSAAPKGCASFGHVSRQFALADEFQPVLLDVETIGEFSPAAGTAKENASGRALPGDEAMDFGRIRGRRRMILCAHDPPGARQSIRSCPALLIQLETRNILKPPHWLAEITAKLPPGDHTGRTSCRSMVSSVGHPLELTGDCAQDIEERVATG